MIFFRTHNWIPDIIMQPSKITNATSLDQKAASVIRLTRWREHVPYTIPLVLGGGLLAAHLDGAVMNWQLGLVLLANVLAMAFAFMLNDVVDAPDDARDPVKHAQNVISSGILTQREGNILSAITFAAAIGLYATGGWRALGVGSMTLLLCYLYSAPPFRFKARPVVDVLSHVLMLATLLMLSGYVTYGVFPGAAWWVIAAITLGSAYGQFYNQLDDFETDQHASLRNTAHFVGERGTRWLMTGSLLGAAGCLLIALWLGVFPDWLGWCAIAISVPMLLFRWQVDMRGHHADVSGNFQIPLLLIANQLMLLWLLVELGVLQIFTR